MTRSPLLAVIACIVTLPALAQQTIRTSILQGDLSARIAAADQRLGPSAGTILVDAPGEAAADIHLGNNHALTFAAPATFRAHITLAGNNTVSCTGNNSAITLNLPNPHGRDAMFMTATNAQNISLQHCTFRTTNPGGDYVVLTVFGSGHVRVIDNRAEDLPLFLSSSTGGAYNNTSQSNMSSDVVVDHNTVTMPSPAYNGHQATGALIFFTRDAHVTHNSFHGGGHGVQYWGGDGNHDWKSEASPRWLQDLEISDNDCADVRGSCYWGAMGQNIQFLRNRAARCGDACLDIEDNKNVTADGNNITDGGNGEFALLGRNVDITIRNNSMTSTTAKFPLFSQFNNSVDAVNAPNLTVSGNTMLCRDPQINCVIRYQNTQNFVFAHNQVTNGMFGPGTLWQKGTTLDSNTFTYTRSAAQKFNAIDLAAEILGNVGRITGNTIVSNAPQPAGSVCIYADASPPKYAPGRYLIQNNICAGSAPFAVSLELVNGGQTGGAMFTARENQFAGAIQHFDKSGNGHFDIQR